MAAGEGRASEREAAPKCKDATRQRRNRLLHLPQGEQVRLGIRRSGWFVDMKIVPLEDVQESHQR